jgi:hypothetical protein
MAQTTQRPRGRMSPRPATDPQRWSRTGGGVLPRRGRQPQQSAMQKALGMLPGMGAKSTPAKSRGRGSRAGGMAMLTAAAGLAYRNRDKIASLLNRRGSEPQRRRP